VPAESTNADATSSPWEDWAETWAHYPCTTDALETAAACGLSLPPNRPDEPSLQLDTHGTSRKPFDRMTDDWFPLTYALTNLNRRLGLPGGYPFVLSTAAIAKRRFVHEAIEGPWHRQWLPELLYSSLLRTFPARARGTTASTATRTSPLGDKAFHNLWAHPTPRLPDHPER
jgi:hypothetical protein